MPRRWIQRIQDAVHGLMEFQGMESVVVDLLRTPELQRLRKIRQTGLVHLVFPCAEHSRLAHVLGAAYLAVRFSRQIKDSSQDVFIPDLCPDEAVIRDMGIAALCHDLGHGPLSHYWEREIIGSGFDRKAWANVLGLEPGQEFLLKLKWHELVGHGLLNWPDGQLHRLLEQHEQGTSDRISRLLRGEYYIPYMPTPPDQLQKTHTWRTRSDPLEQIWPEVAGILRDAPELEAKTLHGDVESLNRHLKPRLNQHLILRGSRDFGSLEAYDQFLLRLLRAANAKRQKRVAEERARLRPLPVGCLAEYREYALLHGQFAIVKVARLTGLHPGSAPAAAGFVGETTDLDEANGTVQDFQDINSAKRQFLRTRLKFRVSGRGALQLARELFRQ